MSDEPLDEEAARLFAACRSEQPSLAVRDALLAEVPRLARRRSPALGVTLVLVAACVALAVGLRARSVSTPRITAEHVASVPTHTGEAIIVQNPVKEPEPEPSATATTTSPKRQPKPPASASTPAPLTLEEQTSALERVRTALHAGDASSALRELDAYQKATRGGALSLEATLLRIQALSAAGRADEASALAQRFVAANPNSPLADRARRYLARPASERAQDQTGNNGRNEE